MENIQTIQNDIPQQVNWFEIGDDLDSACICISAKRRSGKTYLLREMLYFMCQKMKPDLVILFSETSDFNTDFDYVSEYFKYNKYDEEKLMRYIHQQEENMKLYKQKKKKNKNYNKEPPHILVLMDDVAHDKSVFYSHAIGQLAILGRKCCVNLY